MKSICSKFDDAYSTFCGLGFLTPESKSAKNQGGENKNEAEEAGQESLEISEIQIFFIQIHTYNLFKVGHVGDSFQVGSYKATALLELEQGVLQGVQGLLQRLPFLLPVHVVLILVLLLHGLVSSWQLWNVWPVSTTPEMFNCCN